MTTMRDYCIPYTVLTESSPLLGFVDGGLKMGLMQEVSVDPSMTVTLSNLHTGKKKNQLSDFQMCYMPVVSERLFQALPDPLPASLSYCPVDFDFKTTGGAEQYYLLQIAPSYRLVDREHSHYRGSERIIRKIKKLVLDTDALAAVPAEHQSIIHLRDYVSASLWDVELARLLMQHNFSGLRFASIDEWHSGLDNRLE